MRQRSATALALAVITMSACGLTSPSEELPSPSATTSPSAPAATPSAIPSDDPTPTLAEPPSPPASPEPEPLGRSIAQLRSTGDVQANVELRLALNDGFMAVWCDAPNDCAKAANSLQIMGEGLGDLGRHRTQAGDVVVTIELEDRFLYSSGGNGAVEGECVVTFTTSDERGFAGQIECERITNGFGMGSLEVSVSGTFVSAS
jgi:hypothetical protein